MTRTDKTCLCETRLGYSLAEAVNLIGVSQRTGYRLIERGLLKSSRATRRHIIARSEIERFLRETTQEVQ